MYIYELMIELQKGDDVHDSTSFVLAITLPYNQYGDLKDIYSLRFVNGCRHVNGLGVIQSFNFNSP